MEFIAPHELGDDSFRFQLSKPFLTGMLKAIRLNAEIGLDNQNGMQLPPKHIEKINDIAKKRNFVIRSHDAIFSMVSGTMYQSLIHQIEDYDASFTKMRTELDDIVEGFDSEYQLTPAEKLFFELYDDKFNTFSAEQNPSNNNPTA